jgi:hypothetical protein
VNEHILAAIVADDEAEALLRVEEFDDAFALADDLRGHAATTAAAEAAASAAAAKATATATAAEAATVAVTAAAAEPAAVTESAAAAEAAALLESAALFAETLFAETFALVATASAAIPFAPSIETHACPNFLFARLTNKPTRSGQKAQPVMARSTHAPFIALLEKSAPLQ